MTVQTTAQVTTVPTQGTGISLVDLLDRLLGTGIVIAGDVTIAMAGVDLVQVSLRALLSSVRAEMGEGGSA